MAVTSGPREWLLLCTLVLVSAEVHAQTGTVLSAGLPLPGATVTATLGDRKLTTVTDVNGRYAFDGMTPGTWQVQVDLFGFVTSRKQVEIGTAQVVTEWSLDLRPAPRQRSAVRAATGNGGFQTLQNQAETQINEAVRAQSSTAPAAADLEGASTEAFLLNGSVSRGLQQGEPETGPPGMDQFRQMRGGMTGQGGPEAGGPGAGAGPRAGPGGFGGGAGGQRGGFGGGPGGGRGMRGGDRAGNRRDGPGGQGAFFGNRAGRGQQGIRGMASFTFRNSALDAAPYSLNGQVADKPSYDQYRWGLSIGGPLIIPKIVRSSDTFFFLNYFGTRADNPYRGVATVPTAAERAGDFSTLGVPIFDIASNTPFANNHIPASLIKPASTGLLAYIPMPNQPGLVQNYVFSTAVAQNSQNINTRVNRSLTKKDRIGATLNYQRRSGNNAQTFGFLDESTGSGWNADMSWTHTLSPKSVNTVHVSFNRSVSDMLPYFAYGPDVAALLGIQGTSRDPINYGPPNLSFTNYGALTDASPVLTRNQTVGISEAVTLSAGSHNFSFGGAFRRTQLNNRTDQNARGSFTFSGLLTSAIDAKGHPLPNTGNDFADFLLGYPQSSSIRFGSTSTYFRGSVYSAYAQDDWRPRPNLSFNLGLRYEYFTPLSEKYGHIANLDIASGFAGVAVVTPGATGPYTGVYPDYLMNPDKNNFSPRIGVAWRPSAKGRTQVRGAYGIYYNEGVYNQIATRLSAQPPFATTSSISTSIGAPLTIDTGLTTIPPGKTVLNTFAVDRFYRVPYAGTWSLSVQHELPAAIIVEVGYLGTKGTRLDIQRLPNRAAPGSSLTAEERRRIGNAVGFTFESSEGNSIYHALQVRVMRRFRRGLAANALYTFGKSIDNSSTFGGAGNTVAQDDRDLSAERGLSSFDRRHTLNLGYNISSPVGTRNGLMQGHPWAMRLLRDWNLNGGIAISSGSPFTARVLGNVSDTGGTGAVGAGRADATGLPLSLLGAWFNPAAFSVPAAGRYGNAGRNTIPGPGSFALNASFGRSFALAERRRLEFRMEANNLTNHVNITNIGTVVNSNTYGFALAAAQMRTVQGTVRLRF